jgi:hypothetical protein
MMELRRLEQQHKGDSPEEENPVITGTDVVDSESAQDNPLLPLFVLGSVAFVILSIADDDSVTGGWSLLVESAVCGFLFLPLYAVYLASRFGKGTLTGMHIVSFMVLLGFCVLAMTVAGMGSPA